MKQMADLKDYTPVSTGLKITVSSPGSAAITAAVTRLLQQF